MQANLVAKDALADVHQLVEQMVPLLFDRERMSKYVLGKQWLHIGRSSSGCLWMSSWSCC